MMIHKKRSLICLVFLCSLCLPVSIESVRAANWLKVDTNYPASDARLSAKLPANYPPKKTKKKKRGNPLDKKHKMKNGRHCPSF